MDYFIKMAVQYIVTSLFFVLSFLIATSANGQEFPIEFSGITFGAIEEIRVDSNNSDRIIFTTIIRFDSITAHLDNYLRNQGNFSNRCSRRLYWSGNTSIRGTGTILKFSSRARYEQWLCSKLGKAKLFRDTKNLHWELFFRQNGKEFEVVARLNNIKNFPNFLEKAFRLRIEKGIKIPIPKRCGQCWCKDIQENLNPQLERADFSQRPDGKIVLEAAISFSLQQNLIQLTKCL